MMNINFVDLRRQYRRYKEEIDTAISGVCERGEFILGSEVDNFEREFAAMCGAQYCIGVASGTDAIIFSLKALGIKEGDEVITVPNSFFSTALGISMLGAKPVFVDIDPRTYTIDPSKIEEKITKKTKAILPVHLYGRPADVDQIRALATKHGLFIAEDACQAHGARYKGSRVGVLGDVAAFSFHPSKNIGAYGDAGAVVTNNKELVDKVLHYRTYGGIKRDCYITYGTNSRLDALQAAILRVKLRHVDEWTTQRCKNALLYDKFLSRSGVVLPPCPSKNFESVYHAYVIRVKNRDNLKHYLAENGVSTIVHYPVPIHLQPVYSHFGYAKGDFPITEKYANEIVSLPIFPELTESEIGYITGLINEFYKKA